MTIRPPLFAPKPAILEVLMLGPNHALGIRKDIERRSGRQLILGPLRLRLALWSLERDGLLRIWKRAYRTIPTYYALTDQGADLGAPTRHA